MKKHFRKHDPGHTSSLSLPVPLEPSPLPGLLLAAQTPSILPALASLSQLPAPSLQVLLALPNPSGSSAPSVTPHQATTQQLLPSPCFNFPDPSQPLRAQTRGAAAPQPCALAEGVRRDGPAGHARPNCCSSPSPHSVAGGDSHHRAPLQEPRAHLLQLQVGHFFCKERKHLRSLGSAANRRSTTRSIFPAACKTAEVCFPPMAESEPGGAGSSGRPWPSEISPWVAFKNTRNLTFQGLMTRTPDKPQKRRLSFLKPK